MLLYLFFKRKSLQHKFISYVWIFFHYFGHSLHHENIYLESNTYFFGLRIKYITIIYDNLIKMLLCKRVKGKVFECAHPLNKADLFLWSRGEIKYAFPPANNFKHKNPKAIHINLCAQFTVTCILRRHISTTTTRKIVKDNNLEKT